MKQFRLNHKTFLNYFVLGALAFAMVFALGNTSLSAGSSDITEAGMATLTAQIALAQSIENPETPTNSLDPSDIALGQVGVAKCYGGDMAGLFGSGAKLNICTAKCPLRKFKDPEHQGNCRFGKS